MRKLVDSFGRIHNYLRISLTERCNLRCQYCMPAEGVNLQPDSHILTTSEILTLSKYFVSNGVNKIRLTGGEPTVRRDFMEIVELLGQIDGLDKLAITTNGLTLPRKLPSLKEMGLTGVNISLDTSVEAKYRFFTRRQGLERVLESIHRSIDVGIPNVKVNCVVMRGQNDDESVNFIGMTRDLPIQIRFIEYMPFDGNKWQQKKMISYFEMLTIIENAGFKLTRKVHEPGETSKNFTIEGRNGEKHAGSAGFITSMTSNFCGTCNRLRITADGNSKVCLFGNEEVSLRDMSRSGASHEEIQRIVDLALYNKKKEHAGMDTLKDKKNRPMILIGGPHDTFRQSFVRAYSTRRSNFDKKEQSSHVDAKGEAHMVDVAQKKHTRRRASATGIIRFSNELANQQVIENTNKKGDVLAVARIAGIMAVKQTPNLIPLCHPLMTTKVQNNLSIEGNAIHVECVVDCVGPTGVEMEALIGASITLNTIYDMCKAVDKHMVITDIKVTEKQGGRHDFKIE